MIVLISSSLDGQTLLSEVVWVGPRDVRLSKPAIVSLPHCAAMKYGAWSLSVLHLSQGIWKVSQI